MKKFMMFVAFAAMCVTANAQKWAYESNYTEGIACVKDANGKWGHTTSATLGWTSRMYGTGSMPIIPNCALTLSEIWPHRTAV